MDVGCRKLIVFWVRSLVLDNFNIELCLYYEGYEKGGVDVFFLFGVYILYDLWGFGWEK